MWPRRSSPSSVITVTGSIASARMKYTIDDRGVDWFKDKLEGRLGWSLEAARNYHFEHNGDRYGWIQGDDGTGTIPCSSKTAVCRIRTIIS